MRELKVMLATALTSILFEATRQDGAPRIAAATQGDAGLPRLSIMWLYAAMVNFPRAVPRQRPVVRSDRIALRGA